MSESKRPGQKAADQNRGNNAPPTSKRIRTQVSGDGQRWYAERQTITGHWFAIGAAGPPSDI